MQYYENKISKSNEIHWSFYTSFLVPISAFSQYQGKIVSNSVNNQISPMMTTDGSGGAIITWQDKQSGKSEIYAQRMSATGNPMWTANGIPICTQDSSFNPVIVDS